MKSLSFALVITTSGGARRLAADLEVSYPRLFVSNLGGVAGGSPQSRAAARPRVTSVGHRSRGRRLPGVPAGGDSAAHAAFQRSRDRGDAASRGPWPFDDVVIDTGVSAVVGVKPGRSSSVSGGLFPRPHTGSQHRSVRMSPSSTPSGRSGWQATTGVGQLSTETAIWPSNHT